MEISFSQIVDSRFYGQSVVLAKNLVVVHKHDLILCYIVLKRASVR